MTGFLYAVEREYPVTVQQLWNAWVGPTALEDWYHPTDLTVVPGSVTSDPSVGGWWTVAVAVPEYGVNAYFFGRYTAVEQHHLIHIDFEERESVSWVRFTQFGEMPAEQIPQTKAGMESYFDSRDEFL